MLLEITSENRLIRKVQFIGNFLDAEFSEPKAMLSLQYGKGFYPLNCSAPGLCFDNGCMSPKTYRATYVSTQLSGL